MVQLMHFPPNCILAQEQDHLAACTMKQWELLLQINVNNDGVVMQDQDWFQAILDILPIAAPSSDGRNFE
jgi:hypothetical protein